MSEDEGYIYGYFQEFQQLMLGDYYLVVMLVLDRKKYGIHERRHIVIDYGYVFTLTMDGDCCDPNGIYVSLAKKMLDAWFEYDTMYVVGKAASYDKANKRFVVEYDKAGAVGFDESELKFTL